VVKSFNREFSKFYLLCWEFNNSPVRVKISKIQDPLAVDPSEETSFYQSAGGTFQPKSESTRLSWIDQRSQRARVTPHKVKEGNVTLYPG